MKRRASLGAALVEASVWCGNRRHRPVDLASVYSRLQGGGCRSMDGLEITSDLAEFLGARRQLEYDPAACEAGLISLYPLTELRLRTFGGQCYGTPHEEADPNRGRSGVYQVSGVDLVASCSGDYEPEGLLIWLLQESSYGVWDPSHDYVMVFDPGVT